MHHTSSNSLPADIADQATDYVDLVAGVSELVLAPRTMVAYRWQWQRFTSWCDSHGVAPLPTTPEIVLGWLGFRWAVDGAAAASLRLVINDN